MSTSLPPNLGDIIAALPQLAREHAPTSNTYRAWAEAADAAAATSGFADPAGVATPLGTFGSLTFPFTRMGAISSLQLFGLDELIIFAFYWTNRQRYRRAADIGANLGLHSILMAKCGWQVTAYEPDPAHARLLRRNVELNAQRGVELVEAAVSDAPGTLEFVRVLGNTTSSHLAGAKTGAYGQLERFPVRVVPINEIMPAADFVKVDAEGQEKTIILATRSEHWRSTDMMVEIGSPDNATAVYQHLAKLGVSAFAQKLGWSRVERVADMPTSYRDGSLFVTARSTMAWS